MVKWLKNEFCKGYTMFEKAFLVSMLALQVLVYCFVPDTVIGMICGVAGCICVVLTAKGKISSYAFNFIQMITYMIICWDLALYFEFGEQVFYFIACIIGVFLWKKNMNKNSDGTEQVKCQKMNLKQWLLVALATALTTALLGLFGDLVLGGTLPYMDAFSVALAVIAQILMVLRYREQWAIWILIDVTSLVMFIVLGNWSMVAMYVAWTINAFYGWYNWSKLVVKN